MGTIWIKEFTGGLDTRRLPETTPGGVLLQAVNGHINRGGEFEKRAAFVKLYDLPMVGQTVGLGHLPNGLLVWGHTTRPVDLPAGVLYQQLVHPTAAATKIATINSYALYKSKVYVSATFTDGATYHYYDGVNVVDWFYGNAKVTFRVTGGSNIAGKQATGKFRITGGTRAVSNKITGVFINGVEITELEVMHTGDNATTAAAVAEEINRWVSAPDYVASANNDEVTVVASVSGIAANGKLVQVVVAGNVTTNAPVNMTGGVAHSASTIDLSADTKDLMEPTEWRTSNAVTAQAVVAAINGYPAVRDYHAVWDGADGVAVVPNLPGVWANTVKLLPTYTNGFTTTLTGSNNTFTGGAAPPADTAAPTNLPYAPGDFVLTHGSKMYALSASTMYFSAINDPTKWRVLTANVGAGFVDMSAETSEAEQLMALAKYQSYIAAFAYSTILIWFTDPDPKLNKQSQVLRNTGTRSPHSVCQYGDNDIYYLDESGIRSVRARDSSNSASTADIGVLIDPLVIAKLQTMTFGQRLKVFGLIEPAEGRFWLTMGDLIFVFSYFSGAKVSAWSTYVPSVPGVNAVGSPQDQTFNIDEAIVFRRRIYVRSGDAIYAYGGDSEMGQHLVYDNTEAILQTPFLDADKPAKGKSFQGWDTSVRGVWNVSASFDVNSQDKAEALGTVDETTTPHNRLTLNAQSTHISLTFKSRSTEPAKISNAMIHYQSDSGTDDSTR
jgi:hypothetical protein